MHATTQTAPSYEPAPASVARHSPFDQARLGEAERNALVEAHLPQVQLIADRMATKLPQSVDRRDLVSAGALGLIDAVSRFDPSRGVLFKTYAEMRIRGAMLDSLRDLDWVPRSIRRRAREVESAYARLEGELGRPADEDEVAAYLGISLQEMHVLLGEMAGLAITRLVSDEEAAYGVRASTIAATSESSPYTVYEREEMRDRLAAAIDALPAREREVIALYYVEELTLREIGELLGVTESRVSQIRSQAALRLRRALDAS